jgi:hypothetical protein
VQPSMRDGPALQVCRGSAPAKPGGLAGGSRIVSSAVLPIRTSDHNSL